MNAIEESLDSLMKELGINQLSPEQQDEALHQLYQTLETRMTARLTEELTPEELSQVEKAAKKSEDEGRAVLQKLVPNYEEIVSDELDGMRLELKAVMESLAKTDTAKS